MRKNRKKKLYYCPLTNDPGCNPNGNPSGCQHYGFHMCKERCYPSYCCTVKKVVACISVFGNRKENKLDLEFAALRNLERESDLK